MKRSVGRITCTALALTLTMSPPDFGQKALAQVFTEPTRQSRTPKPAKPRPKRQQSVAPVIRAIPPRPVTFNDPTTYCAANPNSEAAGASYVGQPMPNWIASVISARPASAAVSQNQTYAWRCMNSRVLACVSMADRAECSKPADERTPSEGVIAFCKGKRRGAVPLDVVSNSIPIWACSRNGPIISGYRTDIDQAGYLKAQWQDVTDFSPSNIVGAVPRQYLGNWVANLQTSGLLPTNFRVEVKITGGRLNENIAEIRYVQTNTAFDRGPQLICTSQVSLAGYSQGQLVGAESRTYRIAMVDSCPVKGPIHLQSRDGQLWLEWRRPKDGKVTMSGWGQRINSR